MADTFNEFTAIYEARMMTKEVNKMENLMTSTTNRASSVLGSKGSTDINEAIGRMMDGLEQFQKALAKHSMYDIG